MSHEPFEQMVDLLCTHSQMFVTPATYGTVCAYLCGFDAARDGGPLVGFQQWLVVRVGDGDNRQWAGLVRSQLKPTSEESNLTHEERDIRALGRLLAEFFEYRRANGVAKIFHDYAKWLLRRSWYTGPLRRPPHL